ncbi:MAG: ribosome hibernation-promoting factor, HPF/YfiA family [Longimicrobiales bacterium]
MDVRISARHCTITDSTRDLARRRIERVTRYEPRASAAEVIFSEENTFRQAEVRVTVPGGSQAHAHGEGATFRSALDRAAERLERQLRRRRARSRDRRAAPITEAIQAP